MKKNNILFIVILGTALILMGLMISENAGLPARLQATEALRQKFINTGIPLHPAKYWKSIHE